MICTAPLIFAGGGNRPRHCGKPATYLLENGKGRCNKHARGRGTKIEKPTPLQPEEQRITVGLVDGKVRRFKAPQPGEDETPRDGGYDGEG